MPAGIWSTHAFQHPFSDVRNMGPFFRILFLCYLLANHMVVRCVAM